MRAGRDVYSINHCNRHVTGYLSADDKILRVYRRNLRYYQVLYKGSYKSVDVFFNLLYKLRKMIFFYHDLLVMTLDSFNAFTVTVTPQSVLWKCTCAS